MNQIKSTKSHPIDESLIEDAVRVGNIFKTMNESLWIGDRQHKTIYVNSKFEEVSGYTLKECVGKDCVSFFDEKSQKIIENQHGLRKLGQSSQYEATMVTKGKKKIPMLISGAPTGSGGTMGIFTNLAKLKELSRQEKVAEKVLQHSNEAIVVLNKTRNIKIWSSGAKRIFGYKNEEIIGKSIDILIPKELTEENKKLIDEVEQKKHITNVDTRRLRKTGEQIDVTVSVTKVTDDKNHFIGYLIIYTDVTQRKKINTELQKRFETIQDAYKELGLKKRELDYIMEIAECAASSKEKLQNLGNLIVSAVCMLTKCDAAVLRIYHDNNKILKLLSCFGVNQKWWTKDQISFENSLAQDAVTSERPIIIDDIDSHPKHQGLKLVKDHKFKTLILLPLKINKTIIGSLSLYAADPAKFRLIETDFLINMARQCSLALNAKLPSLY